MQEDKKLWEDKLLQQKAVYALNLCTVSVSQIIDNNDVYVMEQEYDAILNNINLENFLHHDALLKVLKQLLDTINFFRIQEKEKKLIEREYQQQVKGAIWTAVPNVAMFFNGDPLTSIISLATQVGIGYMNYRKNKEKYKLDKERQDWQLERAAIEQLHGLRRELFEAAWQLSDSYNFPDELRLTEKQITQYDTILQDADPMRRFERLDVMARDKRFENKQNIFDAYPPYWYYRGNAALEVCQKYKNSDTNIYNSFLITALESYKKFEELYQDDMEFMREDVIAASCFLEYSALLIEDADKHNESFEKVLELLKRTEHLAGDNFDVLQQCVLYYCKLANIASDKHDEIYRCYIKDILRRLVNENYNVGFNGLLLSRIYYKVDHDKSNYTILEARIPGNVLPWDDDDVSDKKFVESKKGTITLDFTPKGREH